MQSIVSRILLSFIHYTYMTILLAKQKIFASETKLSIFLLHLFTITKFHSTMRLEVHKKFLFWTNEPFLPVKRLELNISFFIGSKHAKIHSNFLIRLSSVTTRLSISIVDFRKVFGRS